MADQSASLSLMPEPQVQPSKEMKDLLIELRKTGEWSYVLTKWSAEKEAAT
jgi:hypothetical protein